MIPTIVSGMLLMKKRRMMEVFPPPLRKFWKERELQGAALLSLTLQIILILWGNSRKYKSRTRFRVIVWFAYMLADSVATIALGILSNDLGQIYDDGGNIDAANQLKAFWAPFFLLHLGGPDTITAYALEDNELYLRHLFGLIVQTCAAVYILILAWTSSHLSYLSIVVIVVGSIKYGERTWTLWKASRKELRETILTDPDPGPNYSKFMEEYTLRKAEGFFVDITEMKEGQANFDVTAPETTTAKEHDNNIIRAHALFQTFKSLFADLILSFRDRDRSQALFKNMSDADAFNVIEIELGFMYDLVYTKAPVIYAPCSFVRRFITFSLTCFVFLLFILDAKLRHNRTDFVVTLLLLVVAIFLEIYAAVIVLASDQTRVWLIKNRMTSIMQFMNSFEEWFKWFKVPWWSNSIAQYSLLWISLKEKLSHKIIEEFRYKAVNDFTPKYRQLIFHHVKEKFKQFEEQCKKQELKSTSSLDPAPREFCSERGKRILDEYKEKIGQVNLEWSIGVEFDQSVLIWHMATEICYYFPQGHYSPENLSDDVNLSRHFSLHMSRYMLYLLVIYPFMLPVGIGLIRFRDTRAEAMEFFKEQMTTTPDEGTARQGWTAALTQLLRKKCSCSSVADVDKRRSEACELLLKVKTDVPPIKVKGDRSKSVLFEACRLASRLNNVAASGPNVKWDLIRDMWLELLTYAACHCRGSQHAQQLRRGGELLTHVWLLMAHFGLTEQFQISQGHARAMLVTK